MSAIVGADPRVRPPLCICPYIFPSLQRRADTGIRPYEIQKLVQEFR